MSVRSTVSTAMLASLLLLCPPAVSEAAKARGARATAAPSPDFYGVNGNMFGAGRRTEAQVAAMARGGIRVVRNHIKWKHIEPLPPNPLTGARTYRWETADEIVAVLARHGIEFSPIIAYSTAWATPPSLTELQPGDPGAEMRVRPPAGHYAAFAAAVAARYGPDGDFWQLRRELPKVPVQHLEIWNEQNWHEYWEPRETAAEDYFDVYLRARAEIKKVHPTAVVLVGGLVQTGAEAFVRRMVAHRPSARRRVDAIGYHVYAADSPGDVVAATRRFRRAVDRAFGRGVPIELNEVGWSSVAVDDEGRRRRFHALARDLPRAGLGVSRLFPYVWFSNIVQAPRNWGEGLGMARSDATLMPAGQGYVDGIAAAHASAARRSRR